MAKLVDTIQTLENKIRLLEARFSESGYDIEKIVHTQLGEIASLPRQETLFGMYTALVIDTIDPLKQNRIRFFTPLLHNPKSTIKSLPWAYPVSSMGGFDDSGLTWVPPAGSTACLIFAAGNRASPYYLGTTWHRDRGPEGEHNWGYNIKEYYDIHEGHRKGFLVGENDGSQVLPPWNTENYNGIDVDSMRDFVEDPEAQRKITYSNIYGFKTPQKHMLKMVDGDYKCSHKNKRMELMSSGGNWLVFKDDFLHSFNPSNTTDDGCPPDELETECVTGSDAESGSPYFKNENELKPWTGVGTPQANKAELPQSGIQFLTRSGHTFGMDDSVEEPTGVPEWETSIKDFDFGCTDKFTGKAFWISATGHSIEMSDKEEDTNVRGEDNYIKILSASGNKIELNDHSTDGETAGAKRGITIQSTSNHTIEMLDEENVQSSPARKEGGQPEAKAKKAFVRIRSGYGLEIMMSDTNTQEETADQYIQIFSPQKDNAERGPHQMRFQEAAEGPGQVFLRVGGDYFCSTHDGHTTIVGDEENNPSDMFVNVSNNTVHNSAQFYYNVADMHMLWSKRVMFLLAGEDYDNDGELGPGVFPVLCQAPWGVVTSDRVFVSASQDAACTSIYSLMPFHQCDSGDA